MMHVLKRAWTGMFTPLFGEAKKAQVAALCTREKQGETQVLLITSRGTGRWIVPKGWPIKGLDDAGAAMQEAWEEAGVREADVVAEPVGSYSYDKGLADGESVPVEAQVFQAEVHEMREDYPEAHQRRRKWFAPKEAAKHVAEPELQDILRNL